MLWLNILWPFAFLGVVMWIYGARQPVYRIIKDAQWFVAVRGGDGVTLSPGVRINWSARADFPFIGAADAYWTNFYVLAGDDPAREPIVTRDLEDVYVARVHFAAPPKLLLGFVRFKVAAGGVSKPLGDGIHAEGHRDELLPDQAATARLLARPQSYGPAMVNFLSYLPSAKYQDSRASSGRAAYSRYGMVALRTVYNTGGHLLFFGRIAEVLREASAGPTVGAWSDVAAMHYPNPGAILSMEHVPAYRAALHHRDAGLERTVVIASTGEDASARN